VAYSFNLCKNEIATTNIPNPSAGRKHVLKAYRIKGEPINVSSD